jgi:RNA polymerase sigma-70 factor (ECF subfamily)
MTPDATADLALAALFRARAVASAPSIDDPALEAALRLLYAAGCRAWPALPLDIEEFVVDLAQRLRGVVPPEARGPDLYLACACIARVRGALETFDRQHLAQLGPHLARIGASPALADEVRQELRAKLFGGAAPKILQYDGSGALWSWVRVVALRTAVDLRRTPEEARDPSSFEEVVAKDDPEADIRLEQYRRAFDEAVRAAINALEPEQRRLLRRCFAENATIDELAAEQGVHRATVARHLASARTALRWEARRRLQMALGTGDSELTSVARILRSRLAVSLPSALLRSEG